MNIRFGILTASDRAARGERPDATSPRLAQAIDAQGWQVVRKAIQPDNYYAIRDQLADWADAGDLDIILTTGGTGVAPRDVTPEATLAVIERAIPGMVEVMRQTSLQVTPHAMLSRSVAGIRGRTLIVNLPGNPQAAYENLQVILPVFPHAVKLLREDPTAEAGHRE